MLGPGEDCRDCCFVAADNGFYRAIVAIAYPAGEAELACFMLKRLTITHTLHLAMNA